jgi:hypothetical protein
MLSLIHPIFKIKKKVEGNNKGTSRRWEEVCRRRVK